MKIRLEIDLEPHELHQLVGISYLGNLQEDVARHLSGRLREGVDPRRLLKDVVPAGLLSVLSPSEWRDLVLSALGTEEAAEIEKKPSKAKPARKKRSARAK